MWWTVGEGGGQGHTTSRAAKPPVPNLRPSIHRSAILQWRGEVFKELWLASASCTMHIPSCTPINVCFQLWHHSSWSIHTHYEGQFVDMKRPPCWVYADGVDIFLPVVLLSRQQGVTSVCQVRGESKPVERSHAAAQPRQCGGPRRGKSIQRAVSV